MSEHKDESALSSTKLAIGVAAAIAILVGLVGLETGALAFKSTQQDVLPEGFWTALTALVALAVIVERTAEILLNATGRQPDPVYDPERDVLVKPSVTRAASLICLGLGVIIAAGGLRFLETLVTIDTSAFPGQTSDGGGAAISADLADAAGPANEMESSPTNQDENGSPRGYWLPLFLFRFSDIALSAGVLAGAANGLHAYIEAIVTLGGRLKDASKGLESDRNTRPRTVVDTARFLALKSMEKNGGGTPKTIPTVPEQSM